MTQGNIQENVRELRVRDTTDPTVQKMKNLVLNGVPETQVVAALKLPRDAPCSVAMIEEAHACAAWVMREHPDLSQGMLPARSPVSQVRACFTKSNHMKALDKFQEKLGKLDKKQPEKVTERHCLFKI